MSAEGITLLGFDYGTQKIGIAVGQTITGTASPLTVITARDGIPDWNDLEKLVKQWQPNAFVVGMPYNMDGSESKMSTRALKFSRRLNGRFNIECHLVDERLTSREAREISQSKAQLNGRKYKPRENIDAVAAQLILESWLASNT